MSNSALMNQLLGNPQMIQPPNIVSQGSMFNPQVDAQFQ